jgi:AsmA protein
MVSTDLALEFDKQQLNIRNGTFTLGQDHGFFEGACVNLKTIPTWNLSFKSERITPGPILEQLPMFAGLIPAKITLAGSAGFSLTTLGTKEAFQVNTALDMKPMAITFGKVFNKPAGSPMIFSSRLTMKPEITQIIALDLNLGTITAEGSGEVQKASGKSSYQIRIQTRPVSLQAAQAIIPMLQDFKPTGNVVVKTTLKGETGSPMSINVQAVSERMGLVLTKPKEGEQPKAKVLSGPMKADMNAVTFVMDALKKEKALTAKGSMKSQGGTFMEVPYSTLVSTFALENDQFKVNSFDLNALKGSIRGSASYNPKTKAWAAAPVFNNVQAGSILDMLTNFKGVFTGTISGDLKATGVAGAPALNNLGAQGNLTISKGEWKNFDLAGTALSSILGVPGASEIFGFAPAEVQKYNATRFESLNTSIDLAKKVVKVDTMKLLNISSGKDVDTESNLKGTISMETNEVHLKGNVVLPKRFSQRMGARAEAFSSIMNDQKRLVLPIIITGSVKKPIPMIEVKSLSSAFTKYYAAKVMDKGLKKLQDKGALPSGTDETRKSLDNMMEGLFKKKKK